MNRNQSPIRRIDIKALLADPTARRRLIIGCIIAIQAREGIVTSHAQAAHAYDSVRMEADRAKPHMSGRKRRTA